MLPDFSGQNLRGRNFKGQDLTEANFSHADIRGANFTDAILQGANFTGAKAGVQKRWVVGQILILFALSTLAGVAFALAVFAFAFVGVVIGTVSDVGAFIGTDPSGVGVLTGAGAVLTVLFSFYSVWQANKGDEKFDLVRTFDVAFAALGGTRFYKTDLTGANFSNAILKNTTLREATLTHVYWKDAKKLDRARVGETILANPSVRELLITRNGYKKFYKNANLRGANLNGVNLNAADLTWADLSEAILHRADLSHANLREVLAVGADFSSAHLTGACLQSWNIDSTTVLKDVDCQYVFLLEQPNEFGSRERRPHDANKLFQPGDFEKFFKEVLDTVQILIRDGINPDAFKVALQTVLDKYPAASVQGIEKQDSDVLLTLKVPAGTNKAEVEQDWDEVYQTRLEAEKTAALLEAKQQHVDDIKAITLATVSNLGNLLSNLTINTTAHNTAANTAMNDSTDQSRSFNVAGNLDITGSTINLGEISGTVTNTIHQLQNTDRPQAPELAALLAQLQAAIESNSDLSATDKTEALEQVSTLAKTGQNPQDGTLKKLANTAIKVIKGTVVALPATATLVEAVNQLLPSIVALLGL